MPDKNAGPPSITLILRALAGGYLLYLSWDLILAADINFQLIGGVFALAGGALLWKSLSEFFHNEYFYDRDNPEASSGGNSDKLEDSNTRRE